MKRPPAPQPRACDGDRLESSREGRDCPLSHRITALLLFPRLDARPGAWLLCLTAVWSFVAVRAMEMGHF